MSIRSIYEKPTGAKAQNVDWITDATPIREDGILLINVSVDDAVVIETTLDGTNYETMNDGAALVANARYRWEIDVDNTMTFNIRTPTAGGTTIRKCLIKESPVVHTP